MTEIGSDNLGAFGDQFYEQLMGIHEGLREAESHALNARLVLLMANSIGDQTELENILKVAAGYKS